MNIFCIVGQDHQWWVVAVDCSSKSKDIYSKANPLLMSYSNENRVIIQKLPEKSPISVKKKKKLLLEIEREENEKLKSFQKLLE